MAEKLKDIKETASDAVEIIRELGSPDVQKSLEKIRDTAKVGSEIIKSLKEPAMVTNIENIRKTTESFEKTSARIERVTMELKNSGILDETRETIKSAKNTISYVGDSKNMGETMDAIKQMAAHDPESATTLLRKLFEACNRGANSMRINRED